MVCLSTTWFIFNFSLFWWNNGPSMIYDYEYEKEKTTCLNCSKLMCKYKVITCDGRVSNWLQLTLKLLNTCSPRSLVFTLAWLDAYRLCLTTQCKCSVIHLAPWLAFLKPMYSPLDYSLTSWCFPLRPRKMISKDKGRPFLKTLFAGSPIL